METRGPTSVSPNRRNIIEPTHAALFHNTANLKYMLVFAVAVDYMKMHNSSRVRVNHWAPSKHLCLGTHRVVRVFATGHFMFSAEKNFQYPQPTKILPGFREVFFLLPRNEAVPKITTSHYAHNFPHQVAWLFGMVVFKKSCLSCRSRLLQNACFTCVIS